MSAPTNLEPRGTSTTGSALLESLVALSLLAALMGSLLASWSRFEDTLRKASVDRGILESAEAAMEITAGLSSQRLLGRLREGRGSWVRTQSAPQALGPWVDDDQSRPQAFVRRVTLRAKNVAGDEVEDCVGCLDPRLVEIEVRVEAVAGNVPARVTLRRLRVL